MTLETMLQNHFCEHDFSSAFLPLNNQYAHVMSKKLSEVQEHEEEQRILEQFNVFAGEPMQDPVIEIPFVLGQVNSLAHFDVLLSARKQEFTLYEIEEEL